MPRGLLRSTGHLEKRYRRSLGGRSAWGVVALAFGTVACEGTVVQAEYLEPFAPPPIYRNWWNQVERCLGLDGEFGEIRWYTGESLSLDGAEIFGLWAAPRTIVVERFYLTSAPAVKHEMIHHITRGTLPHTHPAFGLCDLPTDPATDAG